MVSTAVSVGTRDIDQHMVIDVVLGIVDADERNSSAAPRLIATSDLASTSQKSRSSPRRKRAATGQTAAEKFDIRGDKSAQLMICY